MNIPLVVYKMDTQNRPGESSSRSGRWTYAVEISKRNSLSQVCKF